MQTDIEKEARQNPQPELLLANWQNELDSSALYLYLADRESDEQRSILLREMASAETRHARVMARGLQQLGVRLPRHRLSFRTRVLKFLAGRFGPSTVYPLLHGTELGGSSDYAAQEPGTAALATEERSHARTLGQLTNAASGSQSLRPETWHRFGGGGTLRAAVFGVSDGLVSNMSLVMGVAGATLDANFILLAGLSGMLAGAASMAAGEYVSMQAQRELLERQIQLEAAELAVTPDEERLELEAIYRAKGIPKQEASQIAAQLISDPDVALDSLVREELGLDPHQLGSSTGAALSSFVAFSLGALLPVLPFFLGASWPLVALSLALSGVALFSVGAVLTIFTGRSALYSGGRQLLIGGAAAALTFLLGRLIGVTTGL
jgi:VIT1/CCC1 family predicted Fe2+/Mn2+ transporter